MDLHFVKSGHWWPSERELDLKQTILGGVDAFLIMEELGGFVEGAERQILVGAVRAKFKDPKEVSDRLTWEIADFVPIALARSFLEGKDFQLHDHYVRIDSQGRLRVYRKLLDEVVYRTALECIPDVIALGKDVLLKIAKRSCEFQAVNAALHSGSELKNLEAAPPILNGPDELCDPLESVPTFQEKPWRMDSWKPKKKPWWKIW
jgi:hypothetical protein